MKTIKVCIDDYMYNRVIKYIMDKEKGIDESVIVQFCLWYTYNSFQWERADTHKILRRML